MGIKTAATLTAMMAMRRDGQSKIPGHGNPANLRFLIFSVLLGICTVASANPVKQEAKEISASNLETYHLIQEIVNDNISSDRAQNRELQQIIKEQDARIKKLEIEAHKQPPPEETITTTIVLAAVTVVITVLGVLMAVLSIFGYTNIKQEAIKSSKETALTTVNNIADEGLLAATERSVLVLIENGRFDEIILSSISSIAYRGISIDNDPLEEEEKN